MESRFAFVDCLTLTVRGGRGGNGIVSFRREAFVPKGGPDGGDGGDGGSVALLVDAHLSTLADLSRRRVFTAPAGTSGGPSGMTGARGHDLVIRVPQGTQVYDEGTGELLADLASDGASLVVARGGEAGRGNAAFATPTRRAPRFATRGGAGEERRLRLELKLIASVGLLGLPNAGKSSLLRAVTSSRARVGAYPFTTLHPGLGVVETSPGRSFVIADLPGLIEGASAGAGLGLGFLRHAERTRVLAMLVAPDLQESPARQLELLE
ncbi:GTPase ObgE, partial [Candidatus Fermentibacterales bacterium]|nr:GTPase ObgE [Candidatus Fermentibacterales bacterium]